MKVKIENGDMTINIYDMLEELFREAETEEIEELYKTLGWFHPAYRELIDTTREMWVGTNHNSKFFKLFKDFFMLPGKYGWRTREHDVFYRMTQAMEAILRENAELRTENWRNNSLAFKTRDWIRVRLGHLVPEEDLDKIVREVYNQVLEFQYKGEEGTTPLEVSREIIKNVDYEDFVKTWVDKVYEMFGESIILCPECGSDDIFECSITPGDFVCVSCDYKFSVEE